MKIALPNKGSLSESSIQILKEAGYKQRNDLRDLLLIDPENGTEFYYLRPRDIALYVGSGELDAGITGRDLLIDSKAPAEEILALGFGRSTFRFAAPNGKDWSIDKVRDKRIATAYPGLVANYLQSKSLSAEIIRLDGAVETSVKLGVADLIADVVSTGNTLRQAGLEMFGDSILDSEAILIKRVGTNMSTELDTLSRRLQGVVIARQYVLMDYDIPKTKLEEACQLTPGLESPTISPLAKDDWLAVRAMVLRKDTNRVMDQLWSIGARGILVTDIHACRL
ncbi:MAG: ATP phosphoribosyltransferase [Candidatus Nanopelagicaceae bacterium]